jgi:hypothetical protein
MSNDSSSSWLALERAHAGFLEQLRLFLSGDKEEKTKLLQERYQTNPRLVIDVLEQLNPEDLKALLPFLIEHTRSVHGHLQTLRRLFLLLPNRWLVENVEPAVEPWLQTGDDEYYRRFLELYYLIDRKLTHRLAERAVASNNPDVRDAGTDFLKRLEEDQ